MPQSLVKNYLHITFSTKHRIPLINKEIQEELFRYLGGICKRMECNPIIVGGYKDHVHILCLLSRKIALMNLIETLKTDSSRWIKTKGTKYKDFYWQHGYGAFSVHESQLSGIRDYIGSQEEHHKTRSFKEEYRLFLKEYGIEYNEEYVWD